VPVIARSASDEAISKLETNSDDRNRKGKIGLGDLTPFIPLSLIKERGRRGFEGAEPLQTSRDRMSMEEVNTVKEI